MMDCPGIYLHEIHHELLQMTGTDASIATVCRLLQKCGFTCMKIQTVALQQSKELCQRHRTAMELYDRGLHASVCQWGQG